MDVTSRTTGGCVRTLETGSALAHRGILLRHEDEGSSCIDFELRSLRGSEFPMNQTIKTVIFWLVILVSAFLLWQVVRSGGTQQSTPEISYSEFLSQVEAGSVAKVTISGSTVEGTYHDNGSFRVTAPTNQDALVQTLRQKNVEVWFKDSGGSGTPARLLGTWAPLILLGVLWFFMIRQMQRRQAQGRPDSAAESVDSRWSSK